MEQGSDGVSMTLSKSVERRCLLVFGTKPVAIEESRAQLWRAPYVPARSNGTRKRDKMM